MIYWEFFPNGRTVDVDLYSQQQERVHEIFKWRYRATVNRNRVLLKQDNARPHTAGTTMTNIQELAGIELLPHPAYSPDLCAFRLPSVSILAHFLRGKNFENIEAVESGLSEFFASKTRRWYRRGIINLFLEE